MTHVRRFVTMMAIYLAFLIYVVIAGSCNCFRPPQPVSPGLATTQARVTVKVISVCFSNEGMRIGFASGVVVAPTRVLTAYHAVECSGTLGIGLVLADEKTELRATVQVVDLERDIAALKVDGYIQAPAILIGPVPEVGEQVCIATAVPIRVRRCGDVQISSNAFPGNVFHTAIVEPGNSGGGVFDRRGRLVAITTHYVTCISGQLCAGRASSLHGGLIK